MIVVQSLITFDKELKRLSKKYRSILNDYNKLIEELENNPFAGIDLGNGLRKVRMAIASKGKGKSHGARIITYTDSIVSVEEGIVTLLYIYDKAERDTISDKELRTLLSQIV